MNDFKNAYQSAVQDMDMPGMKKIHIDASQCMDEGRHRRRMVKQMRRTMTTTFSAMCIIFVCGFGTVKAAEYIENVIKVNKWGFESADAVTMAKNEAQGGQVYVVEDETQLAVVPEESVETEPMIVSEAETTWEPEGAVEEENFTKLSEENEAQTEGVAVKENGESALISEAADANTMTSNATTSNTTTSGEALTQDALQIGVDQMSPMMDDGISSKSGNGGEQALAAGEVTELSQGQQEFKTTVGGVQGGITPLQEEAIPVKNYTSWDDFEKNENILFPQPSIEIGKQITATDITVCGDWAMVRYDVDGKVLWLERTDYADTQGHAASKVFPSGVCNERTYVTPAGYTYTLIDSVKESETEQLQIHAAITVGSYEAYIDFMGFTEEDAKKIMDSIDLSVYE